MNYPRISPFNPYYPKHKRTEHLPAQTHILYPYTHRTSSPITLPPPILPSFSPNKLSRSPHSISPHKIIQRIYLQDDPNAPILNRTLHLPKELDPSIGQQLDQRFHHYQYRMKRKYNDLFSRAKNLNKSLRGSEMDMDLKEEESTGIKETERAPPGCF